MNPKLNKTKRTAVLDQQNSKCTLCKRHLNGTKDARHDKRLNYMLCPACMLVVSSVRAAQDRGVTLTVIVDYESQEPQDDVVIKSDRRKCVEDGRLLHREPDGTRREYKDWEEACRLKPGWWDVEEKLNS